MMMRLTGLKINIRQKGLLQTYLARSFEFPVFLIIIVSPNTDLVECLWLILVFALTLIPSGLRGQAMKKVQFRILPRFVKLFYNLAMKRIAVNFKAVNWVNLEVVWK